jgi:hypothetical protein
MTIYHGVNECKHIPYTYLIGWSKHDKWYYGVEYSKNQLKIANPKNLWTVYFTSSKQVALFRKKYGEPDVVQVRKTFDCPQKAILWETKVLKRLNAPESKKWLNVAITTEKFNTSNKTLITNGQEQYMIDKDDIIPDGWYRGRSEKFKERVRKSLKNKKWNFTEESRKNLSEIYKNSVLITNDIIIKRHPKNEPIPEGFRRGKSRELAKKSSEKLIGVKHSEERKKNISESQKGFKHINNGIIGLRIKGSELPEGFVWGRKPRTKEHNENATKSHIGLRWYTNGTVDRKFRPENVPPGFTPGRCLKYKYPEEALKKRSTSFKENRKKRLSTNKD